MVQQKGVFQHTLLESHNVCVYRVRSLHDDDSGVSRLPEYRVRRCCYVGCDFHCCNCGHLVEPFLRDLNRDLIRRKIPECYVIWFGFG